MEPWIVVGARARPPVTDVMENITPTSHLALRPKIQLRHGQFHLFFLRKTWTNKEMRICIAGAPISAKTARSTKTHGSGTSSECMHCQLLILGSKSSCLRPNTKFDPLVATKSPLSGELWLQKQSASNGRKWWELCAEVRSRRWMTGRFLIHCLVEQDTDSPYSSPEYWNHLGI